MEIQETKLTPFAKLTSTFLWVRLSWWKLVETTVIDITYNAKLLSLILWWKQWLNMLNLTLENLRISSPVKWSDTVKELSDAKDWEELKKVLRTIGMYNN